MRHDKRLLPVEGEPLLRRVLAVVAAVGDDLLVVESRRSPVPRDVLAGFSARIACDAWPDAGPLAGIEAGLRAALAPTALVVAADAPWLQPDLLRLLARQLDQWPDADAAAVRSERGLEPLLAVYRTGVSTVARSLLESGERRASALLDAVQLRAVDASVWRSVDPEGLSLRNLNLPADVD